jgi:hypothetical protein
MPLPLHPRAFRDPAESILPGSPPGFEFFSAAIASPHLSYKRHTTRRQNSFPFENLKATRRQKNRMAGDSVEARLRPELVKMDEAMAYSGPPQAWGMAPPQCQSIPKCEELAKPHDNPMAQRELLPPKLVADFAACHRTR